MQRTRGWAVRAASLAALVMMAGSLPAQSAQVHNLDAALRKNAPVIVHYLHQKGDHDVGVLKFLVDRGDGKLSDNVGTLNRSVANRLEVALVLALTDAKVGLITQASDGVAASGNLRATHRTPRGRREFFRINPRYFQRAWGPADPVQPDAFLTGEVRLGRDRRTLDVKVQAFDREDPNKLATVCEFQAVARMPDLAEAGLSFVRSRGAEEPDDNVASAFEPRPQATEEEKKDEKKGFDELLKKSPVRLEVCYNDKPVAIEAGAVPTPGEGDKVTFRLTNEGTETYGVVLKVNGRNTIFHEDMAPLYCYKWILEPGKSVTIKGFQKDDGKDEEFEVKSPEESRGYAVQYGENAGTFSMVVFRGTKKEDEVFVKNEDRRTEGLKPISRGSLSAKGPRASTLEALKGDLLKQTRPDVLARGSKGLIMAGPTGESKIERVSFNSFPREVMALTIRYYQPK